MSRLLPMLHRPMLRKGVIVSIVFAAAGLLALPTLASAEEGFRIRLSRSQGRQVFIYHDAPKSAATATAGIQLGATLCKPVSGETMRPLRGGDALTTLIVLDRGGTATTGMGQYSDDIRKAVGGFLGSVVGKNEADRVSIVDTSGKDKEPSQLAATGSKSDVEAFLNTLPPPSGSGADIYGTARLALAQLDRQKTPLGAVIIISDGIDPAANKDPHAADNHGDFIRDAQRRHVPVATIHIGRSGEKRGDGEVKFRNGRARLMDIVSATNGDFRSIPVGKTEGALEPRLRKELDALGADFAAVTRTLCEPCGKVSETRDVVVDMRLEEGGKTVARSIASPKPLLSLQADDYGACGDTTNAPASASGDASGPACSHDPDCGASQKCDGGRCVERTTLRSYLPHVAGGLLVLAIGLLLVGMRRKQARQRQAQAEALERQQQEAAEAVARERERAAAERQRLESELQAARSATGAPAEPAAPRAPTVTVGVRLVAAAGCTVPFDKAFGPGTHLIGSAADCDAVLAAQTVSGHHLQLVVHADGRAEVMDIGSSNGTFLNQVQIGARQPVEVRPGDVIALSRQAPLQVFTVGSEPAGRSGRGRTVLQE